MGLAEAQRLINNLHQLNVATKLEAKEAQQRLEEENAVMQKELEQTANELGTMEKRLTASRKEQKQLTSELGKLKQAMVAAEKKHASELEEANAKLQADSKTSLASTRALESKLAKMTSAMGRAQKNAARTLSATKAELSGERAQTSKWKARAEQLGAEVNKVKKAAAEAAQKQKEANREAASRSSDIAKECERFKKERDQFKKELGRSTKRVSSLSKELGSINKKHETALRRVMDQNKEHRERIAQLNAAREADARAAKESAGKLAVEKAALRNALDVAEKDLATARNRESKLKSEAKDRILELTSRRAEIKSLKEILQGKDSAVQDTSSKVEALERARADAERRATEANQKLKDLGQQTAQSAAAKTAATSELQSMRARLEASEKKAKEAAERILRAEAEREAGKQAIVTLRSQAAAARSEAERGAARLRDTQSAKLASERAHSSEIAAVRADLEAARAALATAREDQQSHASKGGALKKAVVQLESELERARSESQVLRSKAKTHDRSLARVRGRLAEAEAARAQAMSEVAALQKSLSESRQKITEIKAEAQRTAMLLTERSGDVERIERLRDKIRRQTERSRAITREAAQAAERAGGAEAARRIAEARVSQLEAELRIAKVQSTRQKSEADELREEIKGLASTLETARSDALKKEKALEEAARKQRLRAASEIASRVGEEFQKSFQLKVQEEVRRARYMEKKRSEQETAKQVEAAVARERGKYKQLQLKLKEVEDIHNVKMFETIEGLKQRHAASMSDAAEHDRASRAKFERDAKQRLKESAAKIRVEERIKAVKDTEKKIKRAREEYEFRIEQQHLNPMGEKIANLTKQIFIMSERNQQLAAELAAAEAEREDDIRAVIRYDYRRVEAFKTRVEQRAVKGVSELKKRLEEAKLAGTEREAKAQSAIEELQKYTDALAHSSKKQLAAFRERVGKVKRDFSERLAEFERANQDRTAAHSAEIKRRDEEAEALRIEASKLRTELETARGASQAAAARGGEREMELRTKLQEVEAALAAEAQARADAEATHKGSAEAAAREQARVIAEMRAAGEDSEARAAALQRTLRQSQARMKTLRQQVAKMKHLHEQNLEGRLAEKTKQLESLRAELASAVGSLERARADAKARSREEERRMRALAAKNEQLMSTRENQGAELAAAREHAAQLDAEVQRLEEAVKKSDEARAESEIASRRREGEARAEFERLAGAAAADAEERLRKAQVEHAAAVEGLESLIAKANKERQALRARDAEAAAMHREEASRAAAELAREKEAASAREAELRSEVEELASVIRDEKSEFAKMKTEFNSQQDKSWATDAKARKIRLELERVRASLASERDAAAVRIRAAEKNARSLELAVRAADDRVVQLRSALAEKERELDRRAKYAADAAKRHQDRLRKESGRTQAAARDASNKLRQNLQLRSQLAAARKDQAELRRRVQTLVARAEREEKEQRAASTARQAERDRALKERRVAVAESSEGVQRALQAALESLEAERAAHTTTRAALATLRRAAAAGAGAEAAAAYESQNVALRKAQDDATAAADRVAALQTEVRAARSARLAAEARAAESDTKAEKGAAELRAAQAKLTRAEAEAFAASKAQSALNAAEAALERVRREGKMNAAKLKRSSASIFKLSAQLRSAKEAGAKAETERDKALRRSEMLKKALVSSESSAFSTQRALNQATDKLEAMERRVADADSMLQRALVEEAEKFEAKIKSLEESEAAAQAARATLAREVGRGREALAKAQADLKGERGVAAAAEASKVSLKEQLTRAESDVVKRGEMLDSRDKLIESYNALGGLFQKIKKTVERAAEASTPLPRGLRSYVRSFERARRRVVRLRRAEYSGLGGSGSPESDSDDDISSGRSSPAPESPSGRLRVNVPESPAASPSSVATVGSPSRSDGQSSPKSPKGGRKRSPVANEGASSPSERKRLSPKKAVVAQAAQRIKQCMRDVEKAGKSTEVAATFRALKTDTDTLARWVADPGLLVQGLHKIQRRHTARIKAHARRMAAAEKDVKERVFAERETKTRVVMRLAQVLAGVSALTANLVDRDRRARGLPERGPPASAFAKKLPGVASLNMSGHGIEDAEAVVIANALHDNQAVSEVLVRNNRISDKGFVALAISCLSNKSSVSRLDATYNNVTLGGVTTLAQVLLEFAGPGGHVLSAGFAAEDGAMVPVIRVGLKPQGGGRTPRERTVQIDLRFNKLRPTGPRKDTAQDPEFQLAHIMKLMAQCAKKSKRADAKRADGKRGGRGRTSQR